MFEGAGLDGLGALLFPNVASHDVIAKAIVEGALVRGRRAVKRPRSLRLVMLLRGILPDAVFNGLAGITRLETSMDRWRGPEGDTQTAGGGGNKAAPSAKGGAE